MSDCRRIGERLAAYTDDTLPAPERAAVDQHLAACPPCRRSAEIERAGRAVLRERAEQLRATPLPPGLRTRCEALVREQPAGTPVQRWQSRLVPAAIMTALILMIGAAVLYVAASRSEAVLAAQITADHDRCFRNYVSPGAPSLDAAAVEADLATRYGWDIHVPPSSAAAGVQLVLARRCLLGRAPHILYKAGEDELSLYVLEGEDHGHRDINAFGHRARIWTRQGTPLGRSGRPGATTYVLVSAADAGDLRVAENYLRGELQ